MMQLHCLAWTTTMQWLTMRASSQWPMKLNTSLNKQRATSLVWTERIVQQNLQETICGRSLQRDLDKFLIKIAINVQQKIN